MNATNLVLSSENLKKDNIILLIFFINVSVRSFTVHTGHIMLETQLAITGVASINKVWALTHNFEQLLLLLILHYSEEHHRLKNRSSVRS